MSITSGGLFYAALQEAGDIYVFDADLGASGAVTEVDRFAVRQIGQLHVGASTHPCR